MEYKTILTSLEDNILLVTINRPKALNALNYQVFSDLKTIFEKHVPSIEGLKGVIITGAGSRAFVAGADITELKLLDEATAKEQAKRGQDIFDLIENSAVPVVAVVNGFALGGGCELAMACHIRIANEKARFGQPEVNLGIIPGYAGTQRLTRLVGKGKAMELILTADMIGAEEAKSLGLVNHVVPVGHAMRKAKAIIQKIGTKAPLAVAESIRCINAYFGEDGCQAEIDGFGYCATTQDFKEGVSAFLEKRSANFIGK